MSEWKNSPLSDVLEKIVGGGTPSRLKSEYWDGFIPWMSIKDYSDGKLFISDTLEHITIDAIRECATNLIPKGTPIIGTRVGVGKIAISTVDIAINQDLKALFPNTCIDKTLLAYSLFFKQSDLVRIGVGSTVIGITLEQLKTTSIQFPTSLAEQRKIARILSTVDAVIEKTEAAIAKYKAIKAGMMHDLFTRGIDLESGKLRPRYEDTPELYKESELGWVPREWEVVSWEAACENVFVGIATSTTKYFTELGVPLIRNQNILENKLDTTDLLHITKEFAQMNSSKTIRTGDVLSIRTGYPGLSAVALPAHDGFQSFTTLISRPKTENNSKFLCYLLNSHIGRRQILNLQGGGAQQNLNVGWLVQLKVPRPDVQEQNRITAQIDSIENLVDAEVIILNKNQQLKSALMSDLLTGKVRVKYDENEKAEVQ